MAGIFRDKTKGNKICTGRKYLVSAASRISLIISVSLSFCSKSLSLRK
jgi:hypothetical protein